MYDKRNSGRHVIPLKGLSWMVCTVPIGNQHCTGDYSGEIHRDILILIGDNVFTVCRTAGFAAFSGGLYSWWCSPGVRARFLYPASRISGRMACVINNNPVYLAGSVSI
jgi:hypothetical protein